MGNFGTICLKVLAANSIQMISDRNMYFATYPVGMNFSPFYPWLCFQFFLLQLLSFPQCIFVSLLQPPFPWEPLIRCLSFGPGSSRFVDCSHTDFF